MKSCACAAGAAATAGRGRLRPAVGTTPYRQEHPTSSCAATFWTRSVGSTRSCAPARTGTFGSAWRRRAARLRAAPTRGAADARRHGFARRRSTCSPTSRSSPRAMAFASTERATSGGRHGCAWKTGDRGAALHHYARAAAAWGHRLPGPSGSGAGLPPSGPSVDRRLDDWAPRRRRGSMRCGGRYPRRPRRSERQNGRRRSDSGAVNESTSRA